MFAFTWRDAFNASEFDGSDAQEQAFKAGWLAALAQIIAAVQDEYSQAESGIPE